MYTMKAESQEATSSLAALSQGYLREATLSPQRLVQWSALSKRCEQMIVLRLIISKQSAQFLLYVLLDYLKVSSCGSRESNTVESSRQLITGKAQAKWEFITAFLHHCMGDRNIWDAWIYAWGKEWSKKNKISMEIWRERCLKKFILEILSNRNSILFRKICCILNKGNMYR